MTKPINIFTACLLLSWALLVFWNLNHQYGWFSDLDIVWGASNGLILLGCGYYIDSTIKYGFKKVITQFFLYTTISNLCDELFFDPHKVSLCEWVSGLIVFIIIKYLHTTSHGLFRISKRDRD